MKPVHLILASDISGLGKVAVTAALPILAACQVEVAVLPTVLLSSHTGGFSNLYIEDYSVGMTAFLNQWQSLDLDFSGMITGYFKTAEQLEKVEAFSKNKSIPLVVDPIMGDRGNFYQGFDKDYAFKMRGLCHEAKLILPNLTEACFLLGIPYPKGKFDEDLIREVLEKLSQLGVSHICLTGLELSDEEIGVAYFDSHRGYYRLFRGQRVNQHFFGTGDILTAILGAAYFQGLALEDVIPLAMEFIKNSLQLSLEMDLDRQYGVYYQPYLGKLVTDIRTLLEEKNEI